MKMDPIPLLQELIRIPSVNPSGDPGTEHTGEARIAEFLHERLAAAGAAVELQEVLPGRPNLIARFPAEGPGKPRLLLAPHTDTVSVAGMTIDPFGGERREGRIWGRGASDTKGPMAAMLTALFALGAEGIASLDWEICFAGLMGEEAGLYGSQALAEEETFDFVIVGEPTSMKAVHAHKGSARLHMKMRGRSAHSSTPEAGVNAIDAIVQAIADFREAFERASAAHPDPRLGHSTLSLGVIHGGTKINIVPDLCEAEVDTRIVPGFPIEELISHWRASHPEIALEVTVAPPLDTNTAHPMFQILEVAGISPTTAPWFCDAAPFNQKGIPAIALGPGSIAQAHTADEWISEEDLRNGADQFLKFLRSLT